MYNKKSDYQLLWSNTCPLWWASLSGRSRCSWTAPVSPPSGSSKQTHLEQSWEFVLQLYALSLKIAHIKDIKDLVILYERLWGIYSHRSWQTSIESKLLSSLFKKEQHEGFAHYLSESLSKTSDSLQQIYIFRMFWSVFHWFSLFYVYSKSKSLLSLFAQLLFFKEQWERFIHHSFALLLTKNEQFAWKTDERIPNLDL